MNREEGERSILLMLLFKPLLGLIVVLWRGFVAVGVMLLLVKNVTLLVLVAVRLRAVTVVTVSIKLKAEKTKKRKCCTLPSTNRWQSWPR